LRRVRAAGYLVTNLDSTLILAAPKIGPHTAAIRRKVAELMGIDGDRIGIKAKTPEGLATDDAAIAHAVVLLEAKPARKSVKKRNKTDSTSPAKAPWEARAASIKALKIAREGSSSCTERSGCHCTARTKWSGAVPSTASIMPSSVQRADTRKPSPIKSAD